jgi:phage-related protein (TIGR01555 family)
MDDRRKDQAERIVKRYAHLIEMQTGKAVRPYRADGYVNMMNKYGTSKDTTEGYRFRAEPVVPDELLTMYYEGNGLFAKIIDTPAEEAIKHGFTLESTKDQKIEDFYTEALDELDWEETAMTAIRWARLFGGSIAVMMINDGRGIDEPLDWRNIRSIDDIRVYDRSVIQPDYQSMFSYDPRDPFRTRGSRLGMPEFYHVTSRTGSFTVHDSRCLVFQNGILPENTTNSIYQLWGIPEYVRINRAIRDAEVAHGSATKLLDRSVQAVYKMKDLAAELATEEGEDRVLRRLQTIDMARGLLNSITIDSEGEDYDFRQFQFSGVSDVIDSTCNFLSALTSIPQTILFGRSPAGMNATGDADLENWYNYLERIQKRMVKKNLRYLLSVIFQAGVRTGEVDEVPKIKVEFNPLWSLSDTEQADLDQKRAQTQFTRAQTAQLYIDKQVIDPSEVRAKLADSEEFDVENMLDEYDDEDLFPDEPAEGGQVSGDVGQSIFEQGQFADYAEGTSTEEHKKDPGGDGEAPAAAPAATKLPQDMSDEERQQSAANDPQNRAKASVQDVKGDGNTSTQEDTKACVGVLVVSQGKVLSGTRKTEFGHGLICGPGGHIKEGESPKQAAFREAEEEFGISPKELIPLGRGPMEPDTGIQPYIFLCTEYEGEPNCVDGEMADPQFRTLEEIELLTPSLFQPFADDVKLLKAILRGERDPFEEDGGPGSGNHGHEGVPGQVGGSAPSLTPAASKLLHGKSEDFKAEFLVEKGMRFREVDKAIQAGKLDELVDEKLREVAKERKRVADKAPDDSKVRKSAEKASLEIRNNADETLVSYDEDGNEIARDTGSAHGVKSGQNNVAYSTLHNHPGDTDSCFSDTDVRSFANADEQVMYMTSKTKLYSLQKTSDYDGYSARSVATHLESLEKKYQDGGMTRNDLIAETDLYLQLHAHEYGLVYKQQEVDGK